MTFIRLETTDGIRFINRNNIGYIAISEDHKYLKLYLNSGRILEVINSPLNKMRLDIEALDTRYASNH